MHSKRRAGISNDFKWIFGSTPLLAGLVEEGELFNRLYAKVASRKGIATRGSKQMIDHPALLAAAAILGVLVSLPVDGEAGSIVSRSALGSKGVVTQPFGHRSSPSVQDRHSPRAYDRGKESDRDSSRDQDRYRDRHDDDDDRYHGHDKDRYRGHHDCDRHGHGHGHHDHHYDYRYGRYHYPPSVFFGFGIPAVHAHHIGRSHVGYWCDHCQFHTTAVEIFYDHVHLAHRVSVSVIPSLLIWNPVNLVFVFD